MLITDDQIDDFIERWKNAFNETLSREDARAKAQQLIELYKLLAKRPPGEEPAASPPTSER